MAEDNKEREGPPDLLEILNNLKNKVKSGFNSNNDKRIDESHERLTSSLCTCEGGTSQKIVEVKAYCSACSQELFKKTIRKPYQVAAIFAVVFYGASQFVENAIVDNRYPLDVEFALVESCLNANERPISRGVYQEKKELCLCTAENTMNEISYVRYKINKKGFLAAFKENVKSC
jgi:hypothetical protein